MWVLANNRGVEQKDLRARLTVPGLLAYGISAAFSGAGVLALAGGDTHIDRTRSVRFPVDIAGDERQLFGTLLLVMGYILLRWVFRRPGAERRVSTELQIIVFFTVVWYAAYRVGGL